MAVISNPVSRQNVIDRFRDWLTNYVNSGIVWGTNNPPYTTVDVTGYFGGDTSGLADGLTTANFPSSLVTASEVVNALETVAFNLTQMRNARFVLVLDGNVAPAGVQYDQTQYSNMSTAYRGNLSIIRNRPFAGATLSSGNIEDYFYSLRQSFEAVRDSSVIYVENHYCHASCHSSCHGSRGRR